MAHIADQLRTYPALSLAATPLSTKTPGPTRYCFQPFHQATGRVDVPLRFAQYSQPIPAPMMLPVPKKVRSASPRHFWRSPASVARLSCSAGLLTLKALFPSRSLVSCREGMSWLHSPAGALGV